MSKERFVEEFNVIVTGYCEGLRSYPGEVHDDLVCLLVRDLKPIIFGSFAYHYQFDLIAIVEQFCEAAMFRLNPKTILSEFLEMLPHPNKLNPDQQDMLNDILDDIDECVPGTLERMNWEWKQAA